MIYLIYLGHYLSYNSVFYRLSCDDLLIDELRTDDYLSQNNRADKPRKITIAKQLKNQFTEYF